MMASPQLCHSAGSAYRALYQVFVRPALVHTTNAATYGENRPTQDNVRSLRPFSTTITRHAAPRIAEKRTQKWDDEIRARIIQLVDPVTHKLEEPRTRFDIMQTYDRKTHRLIQVSADEPGNRDFIPICKIIDKKDAYDHGKKVAKAQRAQKLNSKMYNSVKTLELNWAIDGNDLGHRLDRVKEFLEEGRKVEIVVAAKKKGRKATAEECRGLMNKVKDVMEGVPGAKELKPFEGKLGGFGTLMLQGKSVAQSSTATKADTGADASAEIEVKKSGEHSAASAVSAG